MSPAVAAPASAGAVPGDHSPWLIAFVVSIATFMEVLDTRIANVALQHIAGSLRILDESTWVLTSLPGFERDHPPDQRLAGDACLDASDFTWCAWPFAASSFLCGLAPSLQSLIAFRVLQGLGGGGMAPSEQAILADTFPAR